MNSSAYKLGLIAGKNKTISILIFVISMGLLVSMCSTPSNLSGNKASSANQNEAPSIDALCSEKALLGRVAQATEAAKAKKHEDVIYFLEPCDAKITEGVEGYKLLTQARYAIERKQAEEKKQRLAEWKKQGVTIGMTKERVLLSSWGRPEKINTTTNQYGTREQWVYGGSNYLYFQDGILITIQN